MNLPAIVSISTLLLSVCELDVCFAVPKKHATKSAAIKNLLHAVKDLRKALEQDSFVTRVRSSDEHVFNDPIDLDWKAYVEDGEFGGSDLEDENAYVAKEIDKRSSQPLEGLPFHAVLRPAREEESAVNRYRTCAHRKSWYEFTDQDIKTLLSNLFRIQQFYDDNYSKHSLDGTFGLRTAQAELQNVLEHLPPSDRHFSELRKLYDKMRATGEKIIANLKKPGHLYSQTFMELIERPLRYRRAYTNFDKSLIMQKNPALFNKGLNEEESDRCLSQILGSGKYVGQACRFDAKCIFMETTPGSSGYTLTHQALLFIAGEHHGCHQQIIEMLGGKEKTDEMYAKWASTIYQQWLDALVNGNIPKNMLNEDLWYEQGLVTMLLGLVEGSRVDFLRKTSSRLLEEGCVDEVGILTALLGSLQKRSTVQIGNKPALIVV